MDLTRLVLFDVQSGKEELVESDPLNRVDLGGAEFSDKTDELIVTAYTDAKTRYYWKDKAFEADYNLLTKRFPGREIGFGSSTTDENAVHRVGRERCRAGRDVSLRPQDEEADAAVPDPREAAAGRRWRR